MSGKEWLRQIAPEEEAVLTEIAENDLGPRIKNLEQKVAGVTSIPVIGHNGWRLHYENWLAAGCPSAPEADPPQPLRLFHVVQLADLWVEE